MLVIGSVAAAAMLAGGAALAQTADGPGGFGPGRMQGMHGQMGQGMGGMHGAMGHGMHGQAGPGMRGQMGRGMSGGPGLTQRDAAEIDSLKTELGITAAQEPAWTRYAKAVADAAAAMDAARENVDPDTVRKLSPAERFAFVSKIRAEAQKQREAVEAAANDLLATLDDAQKADAADILPGLASGPGQMRGAGLGGPRHHR
jgi:hypothetical protein